jgi:putative ABC transport system permease protein
LYKKEKLYSRISQKSQFSKIKASKKVIWRNLLRHPKKTALNLIGIAFSLIIVAGSFIMATSLNYTVESKIKETEKWDASISISDTIDYNADLLEEIQDLANVHQLDYGLKVQATMENPNKDIDEELTQILGLNQNFSMHEYKLVDYQGKESRLFQDEDEVVISLTLMRKMEFEINQEMNITIPSGKEKQVTIVGVSDEIMGLVYTDLQELQNFTQLPDQINSLYVQYDPEISEEDKQILISNIYETSDRIVIVQDMDEIIDNIGHYASLLIPFLGIIIGFAAIVEFFILYNATLMSIGDHESEYGILRSLGYKKRKIFFIIVSENLLPILISITISLILLPYIGILLISFWQEQFSISLHFPPWIFFATTVVPVIITLWAARSGMKYIYSRNLYEQVQTSYVG